MRRFYLLTGLLLAILFFKNISAGEPIHAEVGRIIKLSSHTGGKLVECNVEHNNIRYSIYPELNLTNAKYVTYPKPCTFHIYDVNFDHAGEWIINTVSILDEEDSGNTKSDETIYSVYIEEQERRLVPTNIINGEIGNYATIYFESDFDNVTECSIVSKNGFANTTTFVLSDNGNGTSAGLNIHGKCGIRMPINNIWDGTWKLIQKSEDNKIKYGEFTVKANPKITHLEEEYEKWHRGWEQVWIQSKSAFNSRYCEVERSDGEIIVLTQTNCKYKVGKVSDAHAGIWKLRYILNSNMNAVEQKIIVDIIDAQAINATVTTTSDKMIHILCQTYISSIDSCLFTSPNGTVINALQGIGNDKYEYFGAGYKAWSEENYAECGLTIREPSNDDYGLWKCTVIKLGPPKEVTGTIISTSHLVGKNIERPLVTTSKVYVKNGDDFLIKCTTNKPLDYCWIRSPNGSSYSIRKNGGNSEYSLPYVGEGLLVGDCGTTIKNADDTHAGNWSCRLGVAGGAEIQSIVPVTVTDSYIIPVKKIIDIAQHEPKLVVNVLPSKEATVQYCWWIRPNGDGFYEENNGRYSRSKSDNSCTVNMPDWSHEDVGTWTCYVHFTTDEEVVTTIQVIVKNQSAYSMTLNIFTVCLLTLTITGGIIYAILFYKRRKRLVKSSTTSYNEFDPSKQNSIILKVKPNI